MVVLNVLAWTAVVLTAATVLVWLSRHIELSIAKRAEPPLTPQTFPTPPADADCEMISVLVAAKDEQAVIEPCLRSMLDQDYPNYEVIVIDDRSRDATGQIIDRLAAEFPDKLKALHVTELPEGWFGKNNAMRLGVQAARGKWLCFIDADCTQTSRSTLSQAVQYANATGARFLSVLPTLVAKGFWERVLQPVCGGILVFWFRPARVNNPRSPVAYANGAFMLMDRDSYDRIGGHETVKNEVNEDIHMARRAKDAGVRIRVVRNQGLYETRMYDGFAATWKGWSRIFYGSFSRRRRLLISLAVMLLMGLMPYLAAAFGLAGLARDAGGSLPWLASIFGLCAVAAQQSVMFRFYPLTGIDRRYAPTYGLGAAVSIAIFANAIRKVGGRSRITWRGTTYAGKQRVG